MQVDYDELMASKSQKEHKSGFRPKASVAEMMGMVIVERMTKHGLLADEEEDRYMLAEAIATEVRAKFYPGPQPEEKSSAKASTERHVPRGRSGKHDEFSSFAAHDDEKGDAEGVAVGAGRDDMVSGPAAMGYDVI